MLICRVNGGKFTHSSEIGEDEIWAGRHVFFPFWTIILTMSMWNSAGVTIRLTEPLLQNLLSMLWSLSCDLHYFCGGLSFLNLFCQPFLNPPLLCSYASVFFCFPPILGGGGTNGTRQSLWDTWWSLTERIVLCRVSIRHSRDETKNPDKIFVGAL